MEKTEVVAALAALAQDSRLDVFRLLVQAGPEGMPAGEIATSLKLAPNTLTFHFDRLARGRTGHRPPRRPLDDLRSALRHHERRASPPLSPPAFWDGGRGVGRAMALALMNGLGQRSRQQL